MIKLLNVNVKHPKLNRKTQIYRYFLHYYDQISSLCKNREKRVKGIGRLELYKTFFFQIRLNFMYISMHNENISTLKKKV